jgi:hypothetical protein
MAEFSDDVVQEYFIKLYTFIYLLLLLLVVLLLENY